MGRAQQVDQVECSPNKQSSSVIFYYDPKDKWRILLFIIICVIFFLFELYPLFFNHNMDIINVITIVRLS